MEPKWSQNWRKNFVGSTSGASQTAFQIQLRFSIVFWRPWKPFCFISRFFAPSLGVQSPDFYQNSPRTRRELAKNSPRTCPAPAFQKKTEKKVFEQNPALSGSKFALLAIHIIIWHIWEDGSRKVNNDEPDLRFFHGNFWPVISQAVRKPCFST